MLSNAHNDEEMDFFTLQRGPFGSKIERKPFLVICIWDLLFFPRSAPWSMVTCLLFTVRVNWDVLRARRDLLMVRPCPMSGQKKYERNRPPAQLPFSSQQKNILSLYSDYHKQSSPLSRSITKSVLSREQPEGV